LPAAGHPRASERGFQEKSLAAEVIVGNQLPSPVVWIGHYEVGARGTPEDPHTFDLVIFSGYGITERAPYLGEGRRSIERPTWKPLDQQSVETLVGEPIYGLCHSPFERQAFPRRSSKQPL
jgi:hypothetical protein